MSKEDDSLVAQHEIEKCRFIVPSDPESAVIEYRMGPGQMEMVIDHTYVPESLRGQGVAAILTKAALAYARASNLKVLPVCSYVDVYMKRFSEWADLRVG